MTFISFTSTSSNIVGTLLTVGGTVTGTVAVGQTLSGAGITPGTIITAPNGPNWTVNNSQNVALEAISGAMYIAEELGVIYWPSAFNDYTWINQGIMDLRTPLSYRQQDWPLPIPDYRETGIRSWTWTYDRELLGKDKLPFRQLDWPLPTPDLRITRREAYSWTASYNRLLIGRDIITRGVRQLTDLPPRPDHRENNRRSWEWWYNQNLIGKDKLPFRQQDWPLPRTPDYPIQLRTWIGTSNALMGQVQLPFNQYSWPLPQRQAYDDYTWINQGILTVAAAFAGPFNQYDWPLPRGYDYPVDLRTFVNQFNINLQPTFVFRAPYYAVQVPPLKIDTWVTGPNLLLTTLAPPIQRPFNQFDWPLPRTYPWDDYTWLSQGIITITPPAPRTGPFNQFDWPLPLRLPFFMQDTTTAGPFIPFIPPPPASANHEYLIRARRRLRR